MQLLASFGSPLSDLVNYPFNAYKSMPVDILSIKLISALPVIAFIALLFAAIWSQAKKYPTMGFSDSTENSIRDF